MTESVVALAGRPNTGKTTLFNALTGLHQRVANFAGCTVEKASGTLSLDGSASEIVDLPGTFTVVSNSQDEAVAFRFLAQSAGRPLFVLCVAEASNLGNDLALALALKECGYPTAVVVNMIDEAEHNGIAVDAERLARELDMPVFLASARYDLGMERIREFLQSSPGRPSPRALDLSTQPSHNLRRVQEWAERQADEAVNRGVRLPSRRLLPTIARSIRIDRYLFHPVIGPIILAMTLLAVFESLFALGGPLRDALAAFFARGSDVLRPLIPWPLAASLLCDGVIAGFAAVLTFLPQIAILFALIGVLEQSGYLPRAGAMVDRALRPFGLDGKVFIPFLSSFACAIPGVMSARTIPNERRRLTTILLCPLMTCSARIPVYTLIISAFVPESWRILGLHGQTAVMAGMYSFGIVMALLLALVLKRTSLHEEHPSPVTVLPPYRTPKAREMGRYVWIRCAHFVTKAGGIIFTVSLLLWALGNFPRSSAAIADLESQARVLRAQPAPAGATDRLRGLEGRIDALRIENSALGMLGRVVAPVFAPIGYDWKLSVAVIASIAAREVFVGTLGTLFALSGESSPSESLVDALRKAKTPEDLPRYGLATAVSLLLFFAIALQCISTIAVVRRETGTWKWPLAQLACFFLIAYAMAWAGFHLTTLLAA